MAQSSEIKLLKRFDQNVEITGTITTGSIVNIAENTQPTMTFIHSGNNPGTNDLIGQIIFQADYSGSPQTWAGIYVDTNASSVRTDMDFLVKSTSGNLETGLKIQGGTSTPKAFFYNDVSTTGSFIADSGNSSQWTTAYGWGDHDGLYIKRLGDVTITNFDTLPEGIAGSNETTATNQPYANHNITMTLYNDASSERRAQLFFGDTPAGGMRFRLKQGSTTGWHPWEKVITTADIGSQSVNYASSAGNADTLDGYHASSFLTSLPSHDHDDRYLRKYTGTASGVDNTGYTTAFTVNGGNLASSIRFSVQGTTGSVVVSNLIDLVVNHSQDIMIKAQSGVYTRLTVKVVSNNNEDFAIELKTNSPNAVTLYLEVFAYGSETVAFTNTHSFTGASIEHECLPGYTYSGTGGAEADIKTNGDISAGGSVYVGTGGGYFYNDSGSRVRINQDFYTNNGNTYLYANNLYLGNTSGDNIHVRGNYMSGNNWEIDTAGKAQFSGALKITESGTAQHILIGNQDSGGVNKPAMIMGVNGHIRIGYGDSWSGEGGTFTSQLTFASGSASFESGDVHFKSGAVYFGEWSNTNGGRLYINGTTAERRSTIQTTNGNLHIDSEDGYALYLNYYEGGSSTNVVFGTGNGGVAAQVNGDGSARFPIYYDYNNTSFYLNPSSTTSIYSLIVGSSLQIAGRDWAGALGVGNNYVASDPTSTGSRANYGAGIWTYSGYSTGTNRPHTYDATIQIMPDSNRGFELSADWVSTSKTPLKIRSLRDCCQGWSPWREVMTAEHTNTQNFLTSGSMRADRFYDVNDTTFYIEPNGTSVVNAVKFFGAFYHDTNNRNEGMFGSYDSTKTDHIWSMGTAYRNAADGSNFGNLYGLAYKHTNNSTGGTMGGGHQMVWCTNGNPQGAIGADRVWHSGDMQAGGNMYANVFYDDDNTAYRLDAAGQSKLSSLVMTGDIRGNGQELVLNAGEAAGYFSGQTGEYVYINAENGIQVSSSPDNWSSGWAGKHTVTICDAAGNSYFPGRVQSSDSIRGPIFYDTNDTGYYVDPASTSNFNRIDFNRYLYGNGKKIFDCYDTYLRLNQGGEWSNGIWFGNSHIKQGSDRFIAAGGNGGTTSSRVYIYGGTYTGTNVIKIDGNSGIIQTTTDSVRAPRFYDYDNTARYVDPAGTSVLSITDFKGTVALSFNELRLAGLSDGNHYLKKISTGYSSVTIDGPQLQGHQGGELTTNYTGNNWALRWAIGGVVYVNSTFHAGGDILAYSSSDKQLKDNIKPIENPIDKVQKISGVEFDWNKKQDTYEHGKHDVGVIAQEIEEVLPDIVTTRDNGYKAVKYEKIVPLLIEAIKEQQKQIDELKKLINP